MINMSQFRINLSFFQEHGYETLGCFKCDKRIYLRYISVQRRNVFRRVYFKKSVGKLLHVDFKILPEDEIWVCGGCVMWKVRAEGSVDENKVVEELRALLQQA